MIPENNNSENLDLDNINQISSDEELETANGGNFFDVVTDLTILPFKPQLDIIDNCNGTASKKREIMDATGQTGFWDGVKWSLLPTTMQAKTNEGIDQSILEQSFKKATLTDQFKE